MFDLRGTEKGEGMFLTRPKKYVDSPVLLIRAADSLWLQSHREQAIANELLELLWSETVNELWSCEEFFAEYLPYTH
jgi:hypothetical protein